jgi:magnesium transporter
MRAASCNAPHRARTEEARPPAGNILWQTGSSDPASPGAGPIGSAGADLIASVPQVLRRLRPKRGGQRFLVHSLNANGMRISALCGCLWGCGMITIYNSTERGLVTINDLVPGCWVNVVDPTPEEIAQLAQWGLMTDFVTPPLDMDETPRTEKENGDVMIVLRIPYYQGESSDIPYSTLPLGIILTDKCVATVCKHDNNVIQELVAGKVKGLWTAKRNRLVLHLLLRIAARYLNNLREINRLVEGVEDKLQVSMRNREVLELLKYQKSLTYFTTALKANELVLQRLQRSQLFRMYPDDEDLLEDALTETQQAIEMTNISGNILSQMMDAFASIISNNLNVVMKFLASVTIVLSLPTMIASFYGMNIGLPLQGHPQAFLIILGVTFVVAVGVVLVFWRKDWF